jgi:putative two-component system response regulator
MIETIKPKILIADDSASVRDMITKYFGEKGFEVITASNGAEAVEKEESARPDLVILDVEMPMMNGFEACKLIRGKRRGIDYIPIVFLSGMIEEGLVIMGLQLGADDYIRKPFEALEVLSRINNLIKMKNFIAQLESQENVVFSMIKSIEARDYYTAGHSQRVADISMNVGKEMGISEADKGILYKGSLLHDIGKIGIPDQILNKPGKLLEEEFDRIKEHPGMGAEICSNLRFPPLVLDIIRHHHEKLDGSGYPDSLREKEIHKLVKIVTCADIYDALTTNRPYRPLKSQAEAIAILKIEASEGKIDTAISRCLGWCICRIE